MSASLSDLNDVQWPAEQVAFMREFFEQTEPLEGSKRRVWNGIAEIEFSHANLGVVLDLLEARMPQTGQGKKALEWLQRLADKYKVSIFADAEPFNERGITNPYELKQWYVAHGFSKNGGSNVRYFPK